MLQATPARFLLTLTFAIAALCGVARAQELSELSLPPSGDNEKADVSQWIGLVKVTIAYHSPNVHGRGADRTGHIWGELVRYGLFDEGFGPSHATPWRAGANENTTITVSHDVKIGGRDLAAGTYALFLKVEPSGPWAWIFSKQSTGWGGYQYDPANDALRVEANPEAAPYTEFLTYGFDERRPASTVAYVQWENKRVPFKIDVPNVNELYVAQMRKELLGWPGFNYQNWQTAAQFCADHKINLDEALVWADKAIREPFRNAAQGREDFFTLQTKAAVLQAMGRDSDAEAVMDKAVRMPGTPALAIHRYAAGLIAAKKNQRAFDIFTLNRRQHPDDTFVTYVGLARGYAAIGDKKNAIANWEIAIRNIPDDQKQNLAFYERELKTLKGAQ